MELIFYSSTFFIMLLNLSEYLFAISPSIYLSLETNGDGIYLNFVLRLNRDALNLHASVPSSLVIAFLQPSQVMPALKVYL